MRRVPFVARSLMLLVALVCCARSARADTLWVTSGHVEAGFGALGQPWIGEALVLQGAGLDIVNSLEDTDAFVQLATTPTVAPGTLADFSGVLRIGSAIGAMLHNEFGNVSAPITMSFNAAPAPLACSGDRELIECTGIAPRRTGLGSDARDPARTAPSAGRLRTEFRAWGLRVGLSWQVVSDSNPTRWPKRHFPRPPGGDLAPRLPAGSWRMVRVHRRTPSITSCKPVTRRLMLAGAAIAVMMLPVRS